MNKKICEVCSLNEQKYRCPRCKIVYCSLNCFKTHKEICSEATTSSDTNNVNTTTSNSTTSESTVNQPAEEINSSKTSEIRRTEDSLDQEKLKLLDDSVELKQLLGNEHLRNLLKKLNETSEKSIDLQMDNAMQEPLFTEFADVCLKLVQDKSELIVEKKQEAEIKIEDLIKF